MRGLLLLIFLISAWIFALLFSVSAIAATSTVNVSVVVPGAPTDSDEPSNPGAGSGQGPGPAVIVFSGVSFPGSIVTILQGSRVVGNATADSLGNFSKSITTSDFGDVIFSFFAKDIFGLNSKSQSIGLPIFSHARFNLENIFIGPTISAPTSILKGQDLVLTGSAPVNSRVSIFSVSGEDGDFLGYAQDLSFGQWRFFVNTAFLPAGEYKYKAVSQNTETGLSAESDFALVEVLEVSEIVRECRGADLNFDSKVNISDFSVFLFFWQADSVKTPTCADINNSGKVDLRDFSILMHAWTG